MKNIVFITILLLSSCQSSETNASEPESKNSDSTINICDNNKSFFPVFGAKLGETTEEDLAELGSLNKRHDYYYIHGQKLWVRDGMFEYMYITYPKEVPTHWSNMGFSWYLTYEQIYNLFECLGFNIDVTEEPHVVVHNGYDSFKAKLTATKKSGNLKVVLRFMYGKEIHRDSENTLYSMKFSRINKT